MSVARSRLPMVAAATTVVLWASAFVVIRDVVDRVSPAALTLGRLAVGSAALWLLAPQFVPSRTSHDRRLGTRDLLALGGIGALRFAGYGIALAAGERTVDAGTASLIVNTVPLWVALLGLVLVGERLSRTLVLALVVGYGGAALIVVGQASSRASNPTGILLILFAAALQASQFVLQRRFAARLGACTTTLWTTTLPIVLLLPALPSLAGAIEDSHKVLAAVLYLALGPTALGYTCWNYALRHGSSTPIRRACSTPSPPSPSFSPR